MSYFNLYDSPGRRSVKGGIRPQSKLKGEKWWAQRWIALLESLYLGGRLARGRTYARQGQVLAVDIKNGQIEAKVQGSQAKPYKVSIKVTQLSSSDWDRVAQALGKQAFFSAKLLSGEIPKEIEKLFADLGLSLLPKSIQELETECSCPDYSNPCKHIAAVYYLVAEEFDRDPFLIFRLRGRGRELLLENLKPTGKTYPPQPHNADDFWKEVELPPAPTSAPSGGCALLRQLGPFPFWRGELRFMPTMQQIYEQASRSAWEVVSDIFPTELLT